MQCHSFRIQKTYSTTLILISFTLFIAISGCSKSARNVSYVSGDAAALQDMAPKKDLAPLQKKSAQELVTTGFIYLANQNLKIAELHFVTAIDKDPNMVNAYIGIGRIEMLKGNYSRALSSFSKARELDADSVQALIGEAQALRSAGKLSAAVKKVNKAMEIDHGDIAVLRELAMIYDLMGKENLSEPLYHEIIALAPDQAASHNSMGLNHMVRGEYPEAILSFLQALALDRDSLRIKNNLASAYVLNDDQVNALKIFKTTVGEAEAYNNIGYLLMTQGHFDKAEKALKKALQLNPRHYVRAQENLERLQEMRSGSHSSHL